MAAKLGELMIRKHLITNDQLNEALKQHAMYGIRLGSSLMVMGYVDEAHLSQLLSETLGTPQVGTKELFGADKAARDKLTGELASSYRAIPFRLDRNRLSVAMSDPTNFKKIEEIGFITGCVVVPYIAPDALISKALSKHYHISSSRFSYQLVTRHEREKEKESRPEPTMTFPMMSENGDVVNVTVPAEFEGFGNLPEFPEEEPEASLAVPLIAGGTSSERYTLDKLSTDLTRTVNRGDVADIVIRYLGQRFTSCALFEVKDGIARGWRGMSLECRLSALEKWSCTLNNPSVMQEVVQVRNYIHGALVEKADNIELRSFLKLKPSQEVLVMPVIMQDDVVALMVVSCDREFVRLRMAEMGKLVRKMSLALEDVIIKQKILLA